MCCIGRASATGPSSFVAFASGRVLPGNTVNWLALTGEEIIGVGYPEGAPAAVAANTNDKADNIPGSTGFMALPVIIDSSATATLHDAIARVGPRHLLWAVLRRID